MSRLTIGRDGDIASLHEAEDWLQSRDDASPPTRPRGGVPEISRPASFVLAPTPSAPRGGRRFPIVRLALAVLVVGAVAAGLIAGREPSEPTIVNLDSAPAAPAAVDAAVPATKRPATPAPSPTVVLPARGRLWTGDKGAAVTRLQQVLVAAGQDPGKADGVFGRQTRLAVIAFQKAQGLVGDGIVGKKTAAALNAAAADRVGR